MKKKSLHMKYLLYWLAGITLLCHSQLVNAQDYTEGDTLKFTVLAERVTVDQVLVKINPLNETSLFWANRQGMVVRRYTTSTDGTIVENTVGTLVEFHLNPVSQSRMDSIATAIPNQIWRGLYNSIYSTQFSPSDAANLLNLEVENTTRNYFSNVVNSLDISYGSAQALVFIDSTADINSSYVYFAGSDLSQHDIQQTYKILGFPDEQLDFNNRLYNFFIEAPRNFEEEFPEYYGFSGDNVILEYEIFALPKPDAPTGRMDYYTAEIQVSAIPLRKYYAGYDLMKRKVGESQWTQIARNNAYSKTHKYSSDLAINNADYEFRIKPYNGIYKPYTPTVASDPLVLKADVASYKPGDRPYKIAAKAKNVKGLLQLRWVPMNYETWELGNKFGYKVERYKIEQNSDTLSTLQIENSKVSTLIPVKNEYQMYGVDSIVAQAIYHPEDFKVVDYNKPAALRAQQAEKDKEERMGIVLFRADDSLTIANACGLAFEERQLTAGCQFRYVISINHTSPNYAKLVDAAVAVVNTENWRTGGSTIPEMVLTGKGGDKTFELKWQLPEGELYYSGFYIERKVKNTSGPFVRVNEFPFVYNDEGPNRELLYNGTLPANNVTYVFRIKGKTPFGETLIATNEVDVMGYPAALLSRPFISDVLEVQKGSLTLKWTFPAVDTNNLKRFEVWRCGTRDGQFEKIAENIPVNVLQYMDPRPLITNYYVVVAIDNNDYELSSIPRMAYPSDEIAPAKPQNVHGVSDENGLVTITWDSNKEEDLKGYIVYYSNNSNGEYVPLTGNPIKETSYVHEANINTLTELSNYKVAAIDYRDNLSTFSAACVVQLPDIIPPGNPLISELSAVQQGVKIEYRPSSSADLVRHEIYRKADYEVYWDKIKELPANPTTDFYIDTTGRAFVEYDYKLVAVDDAGLSSESTPLHIKNMKDGVRLAISNPYAFRDARVLKALAVSNNASTTDMCYMKIYWEYPEYAGIYDFQIYRSFKKSPFILVKSVTYKDAYFAGELAVGGSGNELGSGSAKVLGIPKTNNPGTPAVNTPEGNNPKLATKSIRAFLSCDNDLDTTLDAAKSPGDFKYQIIVRFLDGTTSRFCTAFSIN